MEGSGGHTKECKVRTTTSAKPLLAAAPPFRASSGLILGNLLLHLRHLQPSTSFFTVSFSSAGGYNALSYKAVLSSPSLNCFPPPCFLLPSLSSFSFAPLFHACHPPRSPTSPDNQCPTPLSPSLRTPITCVETTKRHGKSVSLCLGWRHSSRIHEWSLVGRRIPRLRARSSTIVRHQRWFPATLCASPVESV